MGRKLMDTELQDYAALNRALAQYAECEGKDRLAKFLDDVAQGADQMATTGIFPTLVVRERRSPNPPDAKTPPSNT